MFQIILIVDRYALICRKHCDVHKNSLRLNKTYCIAVWILSIIFASPMIYYATFDLDAAECQVRFPDQLNQDFSAIETWNVTRGDLLNGSLDELLEDDFNYGEEFMIEEDYSFNITNASFFDEGPITFKIDANLLGYCHRQDSKLYRQYYLFVFFTGYAFPLMLIGFCYVNILITVRMRRQVNLRRTKRSQGML